MIRLPAFFPKLTAVIGLVVGALLILGGQGHLQGIFSQLEASGLQASDASLGMLASGGILLVPGIANVVSSPWIWLSRNRVTQISAAVTLAAFLYLAWLLVAGVPDHPIALFTAIVGAYLLLLVLNLSRKPGEAG